MLRKIFGIKLNDKVPVNIDKETNFGKIYRLHLKKTKIEICGPHGKRIKPLIYLWKMEFGSNSLNAKRIPQATSKTPTLPTTWIVKILKQPFLSGQNWSE